MGEEEKWFVFKALSTHPRKSFKHLCLLRIPFTLLKARAVFSSPLFAKIPLHVPSVSCGRARPTPASVPGVCARCRGSGLGPYVELRLSRRMNWGDWREMVPEVF